QQVQCCLCLDDVRVPVKITAFHCRKIPGKSSCHDANRVCLICARKYLYLNIFPSSTRPDSQKCLFCPTTVDPRFLNAQNAYEKDFMLMSIMSRKDYPCFHSELGCVFQGGQNELDRHMQNQCQYRMTRCECGYFYKVIDGPQHYQEWIVAERMDAHIVKHKAARCTYCVEIFPESIFDAHKEKCPYKPQSCELCHVSISKKNMREHLMSHVTKASQEVQSFVNQLTNASDFLKAATQALGQFQDS
ncbi:MAG: hypothetical protein EBX50_21490, partial [Chitinophagia bacterium]|nr:hypothetical protein [Chitinophagia bacterium]